jgi:DNA-binding response OmpR family regulator
MAARRLSPSLGRTKPTRPSARQGCGAAPFATTAVFMLARGGSWSWTTPLARHRLPTRCVLGATPPRIFYRDSDVEHDSGRGAAVVVARALPQALEACRRIRAQLRGATILLFAAGARPAAALQAGAHLYCSREWSAEGVALQLLAMQDRDAAILNGADAIGRAALRGQLDALCLTPAERRLVDCLWRYANDPDWRGKPVPYQVTAREADFEHDADPRKTIRTHAGNVRNKLRVQFGDDAARCLRTQHGVGLWLDLD